MRIYERHQRGEAVVGDAEYAHLAVGFRDVLDQPIDGVVGVGRVIDGSGVQRPAQRPGHYIITFRAVLAAHVLHHSDVAAVDHGVVRDVGAVDERGQVSAAVLHHAVRCAVGSPRQQNRRTMRAFRNQNDGLQFDSVAHRNHDFALHVVEAVDARHEGGRCLARERVARACRGGNEQRTKYARRRKDGVCAPMIHPHRYLRFESLKRGGSVRHESFVRNGNDPGASRRGLRPRSPRRSRANGPIDPTGTPSLRRRSARGMITTWMLIWRVSSPRTTRVSRELESGC